MKNNKKVIGFVVFLFVSLVFVSCSEQGEKEAAIMEHNTSLQFDRKEDLPIIGQHDIIGEDTSFHTVPDWEFLTQDSILMSSTEIDDKLWIANFFFSYCPTICRPMNREMKAINELLADYSDDLAFLSFSIDERRDFPTRLRTYRESLDITAQNWTFFTGDQEEIKDLAFYGFQILAQEDESAPGGFLHSSSLVLVDKDRHIRGIYETQDSTDRDRLINDVKLLLK